MTRCWLAGAAAFALMTGVASAQVVSETTTPTQSTTTAASAADRAPVNLGTAGNYVILSKAGITTTGATTIVGNIGVSPIASTAITGFALVLHKPGRFATSHLVTGKVYAANYAPPTPSNLRTAVSDMQTAYTNAAGRKNPRAVNLGAGDIGGLILRPGLYKWSSNVRIPKDVTLSGGKDAVWIFQIAGTLNISSGKKVILSGGARDGRIFWQVAGKATLETTAVFHGNILDKTEIAVKTGAKLNGRAFAQTAVTLEANTILSSDAIEHNPSSILQDSNGSACLAAACSALSP
jgi:hypothetical protein